MTASDDPAEKDSPPKATVEPTGAKPEGDADAKATPAPPDKPAASEEDDAMAFNFAAESATAVWDQDAIRGAGLGELAEHRESNPEREMGPATAPDVRGAEQANIVVTQQAPLPAPRLPPLKADGPAGMSWPVTVFVAVCLGGATFLVVNLLVRAFR